MAERPGQRGNIVKHVMSIREVITRKFAYDIQ